ncbi:MAG: hypothetical protein ABI151_12410 [Chitinophagaceae bacterium]
MNRFIILCFCFVVLAGCASLTKTQVAAVKSFATASQDFSAYPGKVLTELADIRMHRGVYFANSLDSARLHIEELDSIYNFRVRDSALISKADITFKIIDKYAQSLLLLSSDKFELKLRQQSLRFGTDLDSLTTLYNTKNFPRVPTGIGAGVSQLIAFGGTQYIRSRQAREIKKFVPQADRLIEVMTANLNEFLRSGIVSELIDNESAGIRSNYLSFLRQSKTISMNGRDSVIQVSNTKSSIANDLEYVKLRAAIDYVKALRAETLVATAKLRIAHAKLLQIINQKRNLKTAVAEIQQFYQSVKDIHVTLKKIQKYKAPTPDESND